MAEGRRYSFEDIIKSEVEKALAGKGITGAATAVKDEPFDIKGIMSIISEVNKLAALREKTLAPVGHDARAAAETSKGSEGPINKEKQQAMLSAAGITPPAPAMTAEALFTSIAEGLDGVVAMFGDIKLSEAKEQLTANKPTVIAMLRQRGFA